MIKKYNKINDNELIYLIEEGNEEALEIMFAKYEPLIRSKISKFKFDKENLDDYLQECRLMLHKAIKLYNPNSPKTFNKYFDLILTNHFLTIIRDNKTTVKVDYLDADEIEDKQNRTNELLEEIDFSNLKLSAFEKEIYKLRFLRNLKISDICQMLGVEEKRVYNSIQRIKRKLMDLKIK